MDREGGGVGWGGLILLQDTRDRDQQVPGGGLGTAVLGEGKDALGLREEEERPKLTSRET